MYSHIMRYRLRYLYGIPFVLVYGTLLNMANNGDPLITVIAMGLALLLMATGCSIAPVYPDPEPVAKVSPAPQPQATPVPAPSTYRSAASLDLEYVRQQFAGALARHGWDVLTVTIGTKRYMLTFGTPLRREDSPVGLGSMSGTPVHDLGAAEPGRLA